MADSEKKSIRLSKAAKELNVSMGTIIHFLAMKGFQINSSPNTKLTMEMYDMLAKEYKGEREAKIEAQKARHMTYLGGSVTVESIVDTENGVANNKGKGEGESISIQGKDISGEDSTGTLIEEKEETIGDIKITGYVKDLIEPRKRKKEKAVVKIKAINRPNRIITEPFMGYEFGVLLPKDILFHGEPVSVSLSEKILSQTLKVGDSITCKVVGLSPDGKIAYLSFELVESDFKGFDDFEKLIPGKRYSINLVDTLPNNFLVTIAGTDLLGVVQKNQIDDSIKLDEHGSIRLQLVEKPENPLQLLRFVKPIAAQKHVTVENLDEVVNEFLTKPELDAITPEGLEVVRSILGKMPELKRREADQITGVDLYCRVPENSPLNYFIKQNPNYISKHSFWVSVNTEDEEPSIVLFKECPSIVIELRAFSDDVFTVSQFDSRKTKLTRSVLQRYNKRTRLKVAGVRLHFITRYDPVPLDYNTEEVIDYLGKLYDFNSSIIPSIYDSIREKTLLSAKDYFVLSSFLKYQRNKESEKESESVFIAPNRISTSSVLRIGDHPSLRLKLEPDEIKSLLGPTEEDNNALHVAVVDDNGNEMLTGVLDTDGEEFVLRSDHGHVDWTEFFNAGIRIQRRANIKHLQIQLDAIDAFVGRDSLKIYQDLINNRLETPDMSIAEGIEFKNPLFNISSGNNTQTEAVKKALGNKNVLLIQGPPGTGKTTIIVEIIEQLVARGKKVLVCSQAHAAVKNIYDRLQVRCPEMNLLALDEKDEITTAARNFDEEAYTQFLKNNIEILGLFDKGFDESVIEEKIRTFTYRSAERTKEFRESHRHIIDYHEAVTDIPLQKIIFLLDRLKRETRGLNTDLLKAQVYRGKDVILGTCIGIGMDPVMRNKDAVHFDTVIVDEAGKANLAETIVPMQLGDRFVLVGDHRQLPPYFDREEIAEYRDAACNDARAQNYNQSEVEKAMNNSLFSDFFDHEYFPVDNKVTLNYQFRMNPQIGQYISDLFYGGQLFSGEGTEKQTVSIEGFPDAVTFVDTFVNKLNEENDPREAKSPDNSWYNMREVKDICEKILPNVSVALDSNSELTVGIITPYKAQYRKLREALKDGRFKDSIYTIDSIQGSEFDIVVFSFVRAFSTHSKKTVGFLDDLRRLNVSLSRAKKKLILVGHLPTLKNPDSHIDAQIEGMVSPVQVFSSIANRIKRYGELSPIERFMNFNFTEGHLFNDCEYHDDGDCYIVIHLEGFDFISKVPRKGFVKYNNGDTLEVVLSGFDATGRPQFEAADLYYFKKAHQEGQNFEAVVSSSYQKEDGWVVVYAEVDGYELPLNLPVYLREEHPEYMEEGTKLVVQLGHNDEDTEKLFFKPYRTDAEKVLGSRIPFFKFTASVVALDEYPIVVFRCKDNSQLSLGCPMLWHTGIQDKEYNLVFCKDGMCELNDSYFYDFIKSHKKGIRYTGLVVSDDENNYYVEVENFCGIIEKQWNKKRGVKQDTEYPMEISWFDNKKKLVKFKFV